VPLSRDLPVEMMGCLGQVFLTYSVKTLKTNYVSHLCSAVAAVSMLYAVLTADEVNQRYFPELCAQYEAVCRQCLDKVEHLKVLI